MLPTLWMLAFGLTCCDAKNWAVVVAGSKGFMNYRHQANACHAHRVMRHKGIPEERIILMSFNDVATSSENPFPGKLFNKPDPEGHGVDVNDGCKVDYEGADVTRENYLDVLSGNGTGKVLNTTANDDVFIYFVSHGVPGVSQFPSMMGVGELPGPSLHKEDLHWTLSWMREHGKFRRLVYYLETCYSGSMLEGLNVSGVYAVSSANATESGWGTYCHENGQDIVNSVSLNTCIGDGFGVGWMEGADAVDIRKETLQGQYETIKQAYNKSQVLQFGDFSFLDAPASAFIGSHEELTGTAVKGTIIV